jgi:hypothetical protein
MMARPLSEWVASVPPDADPITVSDVLVPNDGNEREDARTLRRFSQGWRRVAIEVLLPPDGVHATVLGLVSGNGLRRVMEVDDFGRPLFVSPSGARKIAELEEHWPDVPSDKDVLADLGRESPQLRSMLVSRLVTDAAVPPPWIFWLLPWDLVDAMAGSVLRGLAGEHMDPAQPLRHYFIVTGCRFSAALEQVHAGLAYKDSEALRVGSQDFCERLVHADIERIPPTSRVALADVTDALLRYDPSLKKIAPRLKVLLRPSDGENGVPAAWRFAGTRARFFDDIEAFLADAHESGDLVGSLAVKFESGVLGHSSGSYEIKFELRNRVGLGAVLRATVGHEQLHVTLKYVDDGASELDITVSVIRPDGGVVAEPLVPSANDAATLIANIQWSHTDVPETIWLSVGSSEQ